MPANALKDTKKSRLISINLKKVEAKSASPPLRALRLLALPLSALHQATGGKKESSREVFRMVLQGFYMLFHAFWSSEFQEMALPQLQFGSSDQIVKQRLR